MDTVEKLEKSFIKLLEADAIEDAYKKIVTEAKKVGNAEYGSIASWEEGQLKKQYDSSIRLREINIYQSDALLQLGIRSSFIISLARGKKKIGVLALYSSQPNHFDGDIKKLLSGFAEVITVILYRFQQHAETKKLLLSREEYISYASHELRNPLTSINGYIQLLYAKKKKDGSSESRWVTQLYKDSVKFTNLLKDLLNIEKVRKRT